VLVYTLILKHCEINSKFSGFQQALLIQLTSGLLHYRIMGLLLRFGERAASILNFTQVGP
jgi:hypothetical protein